MDWLNNIGNFFRNTWENITPWEEDRERKRKEKERASQPRQTTPVQKPEPVINFGQQNLSGQKPNNFLSPFEPKRNQNNSLNLNFTMGNTKVDDLTTQVNGQTVAKAPNVDKKTTDKIPGYNVMSPDAQKKAIANLSNSPEAKLDKLKKKIEDDKKKQNIGATAGLYVNSMGKAIQEAPKGFANLPGLVAQGIDWIGDNSARTGLSLGQLISGDSEEKKKAQRAKLDAKLDNDTLSNFARNWYGGVDNLSRKVGLESIIESSDRAIDDNIHTLVRNQGKLTVPQALIATAGEVIGNVVDPTMLAAPVKAVSLTGKLAKGAGKVADVASDASKGAEAIEDAAKGVDVVDDAIQAARKNHVELQRNGADEKTLEKSLENIQELENNAKLSKAPTEQKKVSWVNKETGEKQFYTPKTDEEYTNLVKLIDSNGVQSRAGVVDSNGNIFHITAGNIGDGYKEVKNIDEFTKKFEADANVTKNSEKMQKSVDEVQESVTNQKAQQAEQNSVKQGGGLSYNDMMARIQQRREEYNANPEGVTRAAASERQVANPNSAEAIAADAQAAGLTQADIDTFVKQYGMTHGELRAVLTASNNLAGAKNPAGLAVSVLRDIRSKGVHGQTKAAMNNDITAQRLAKEAEEVTPTKETAGGTVVDTPAGKTNTETGEIIDDIPELTAASPLQEAIAKATAIVEDLDESVRKMGLDPEDLRRKKQAANRGEYEMTELEQAASVIHTQRLNEARQVLADSGLEFDGSQMHYTPQVRKGEAGLPATREELTNFGYANQRKNAIPLEELDYSNLAEIDYIVKAENKDLVIADSIQRAAEVDGRPVTPESVQAATKQTIDLQKKIADAKGSEKVITNDTVTDLNQIGKNEGYAQEVNTTKAGAISQEPREMLTRAGVYDRGFVQYDNAAGYANEFTKQVIDNNIPQPQLGEALTQSIRKAMPNAEQSTVTEAVNGAIRRIENRNLQGEDILPQVMSAYRSVSKAELFRLGKTTDFADKKMKAVVNEQMNARLLQDNYSKNFAQELDSFIAQRINASLRGMNVVSAAFEMGDVANIAAHYGLKGLKDSKFGFGKVDGDFLGMSKRYGEANPHFLSSDLPQVNKLNEVWSDESTNILQKIRRSYETGENKLLIFRYVEQYKTELFFRQADFHYRAKGLQGTELVNKVQQDYLDVMLPNKIITANRLIGKLPKSLTQYLNWSVQATKRLGRTVSGSQTGGLYDGMSRGSKIARGVGVELAPKVAAAAVLGVPIQQVLGMRDWTGTTDGDFSGIPEEEKNTLDNIMSYVGMSPSLGVVSNLYYAGRRNEIAATDDDDRTKENPNWFSDALAAESTKLIPFYTQINKSLGVQDGVDKGYFENKDGRVQFDAPEAGSLSHLMGLVTGKTYMRENRDYGDNPDLLSVLQGKAGLGDLLTHNQTVDNLMQTLGFDTARDYERPVTDNDFTVGKDEAGDALEFNYNEWVKEGYAKSKEIGEQRLGDAKAYNEVYDKLRRENPDMLEDEMTVESYEAGINQQYQAIETALQNVANLQAQKEKLEAWLVDNPVEEPEEEPVVEE